MNTTNRTMMFVAVAAVSALASLGVKYANRPVANQDFAEVGQEFFADFKDPLKATALSVSKYDSDTKEPLDFSVQQNDKGQWVIPSHHDYPAEAKDRLARTATSFMGVKKLALQSRSKDDWGRYGVADPADEVAVDPNAKDDETDQSRGTRVTMRDSSGNGLVDLIIGKPVEGRSQHFYVRQPEKNNVYIAEINADLSAKFSDWIEPDLLKLNQNDISQVIVDRYSIDEEKGEIVDAEKLEFDKDSVANKWTLAGLNPEEESLKEAAINDLARNLDQLKIVGVRPKPEGLNADLTVTQEVAGNPVILQILQADMQRQGFFIARGEGGKKKLVSNEGELVAGTKNGVQYTLYFGEIARGTDKEIEIGLNNKQPAAGDSAADSGEEKKDDAAADPVPADDTPADGESGPRRYLLVKVNFDEALLGPKPTEPVPPVKPAILDETATPSETPLGDDPKEPMPAAEDSADEKKAEPTPEAKADPENETPSPDAPPENAPPAEGTAPEKEGPKDDAAPGADEPAAADDAAEQQDSGACDESIPAEEVTSATDEAPAVDPAAPAVDESAKPKTDNPGTPAAPATGDESPEIIPAKAAVTAPETETPAAEGDETPADPPSETAPTEAKPTDTTPADTQPPVDPKAEAQKKYLQEMGKYEAEKAGFAGALSSWEERSKSGQKLAKELSTRFGAWYYVISADSFEKLRPLRADVIGPKEAAKPDTSTPPSFDSLPGGFPPGLGGNE